MALTADPEVFAELVAELDNPRLCQFGWNGGDCGNPADWLISPHPCTRSRWRSRPKMPTGLWSWMTPGSGEWFMCDRCRDHVIERFTTVTVYCFGPCGRRFGSFDEYYVKAVRLG